MLYTGVKRSEDGLVQRIGLAISTDLYHWDKDPGNPILEADPRWYELLDLGSWYEQAWRDPWLFKDQANNSFHAFITARARSGDNDARGVIGHARSSNLRDWEVLAPIHAPAEFGHLEVPQLVPFGNRFFLLFSCGPKHTSQRRIARLKAPPSIGTFCLVADDALGPFDFRGDGLLVGDADGSYYGGKFIEDRSKRLNFMAFSLFGHDGRFVGELTDPLPVVFDEIDRPHVAMPSEGQSRTRPAP
jgi:beta-fructofuranosidase